MFNITETREGKHLILALSGRFDAETSPELEEIIKNGLDGVDRLVFDLSDLDYISSAGLRVLLEAKKVMLEQGKMTVRNPSNDVKEILKITGFSKILNVT